MAKSRHEDFTKFFENPTREGLREVIRNHEGEFNQLDFKDILPPLPQLAKHLLGFANSGGGCIVIGLRQENDNSLIPIGLNQIEDKASIYDGVKKFIPTQLKYEVLDFKYEASEYPKLKDKSFQVLVIENEEHYVPFISIAESGKVIRKNAIYVRHGTETEEANYQELQNLINNRIRRGYDSQNEISLENEFTELKQLYNQINIHELRSFPAIYSMFSNEDNPRESYNQFIARMIDLKKKHIEQLIIDRSH